MQINAVNSTSFGKSFYNEFQSQDDIIDGKAVFVDDEPSGDKFAKSNLSSEELADVISKFDETASKINSNVHPATIVATVLAAVGVAKGAGKLVPIARRVAVKAGEGVAAFGAKAFGKIANVVKKGNSTFDANKAVDNIHKASQEHFRVVNEIKDGVNFVNGEKIDIKNNKILNFVEKHTRDILGQEKASTIRNLLIKNKVVNGAGLFDALAALGIGLSVVDKASDKTEQTLDKFQLANAIDDAIAVLEG